MTNAAPSIEPQLSFPERLDAAEITPAMRSLWLLSAGLIALDGFDFFIIGVALPFLQRDFGLSSVEVGAVAVAAIVGSLLGSLSLGPLTDRVGRQRMLVVDIALFVIATAGTAFAWNALSLVAFRFLVGVAIGADYPISVAYITENVPARARGRMVISAFTFQAVGALLGAITGLLIIFLFQQLYPNSVQPAIQYAWRWMLGVGLGLAIGVAAFRFSFLLESPSYYITRGEYDAASKAASILLDEPITLTPQTDPPDRRTQLPYSALFMAPLRRSTFLAALPWFLQDIATYGIGIFTPTIIAVLALADQTNFLAREMAAARGAAIVDLFLIAGFLLAILFVERVGRIPLQIIGFVGMAIGLLLLTLSNLVHSGNSSLILVFLGFFVFNLSMNAGPNSTTFLLSGEVFPTSIRASGAGFAAAVAKAGAIVGTFSIPILEHRWGVPTLLIVLSGCCLLAAILTYLFRTPASAASTSLD